jgi:hypothetical protein
MLEAPELWRRPWYFWPTHRRLVLGFLEARHQKNGA